MVYTPEQQKRLGVDAMGTKEKKKQKVDKKPVCGALGPAWTRGEIEKPKGVMDMGSWKAAVYTPEQQKRLGVDAKGKKLPKKLSSSAKALGPAWTRGEIEKPQGHKDMGSWISAVYTPEQQKRLGVDEHGKPVKTPKGNIKGLGPAWTRGEIERPKGTKDMGTWMAAVYTKEQQKRLGVDEHGKKVSAAKKKPVSKIVALTFAKKIAMSVKKTISKKK